jgi:hypothetical protein
VCPVDDGRRIAGAAPSGTICEVAGAAHNNLWTDDRFGGICAREVRRFMGTILADLGADRGAVDGVDPGGSRAGCAVES